MTLRQAGAWGQVPPLDAPPPGPSCSLEDQTLTWSLEHQTLSCSLEDQTLSCSLEDQTLSCSLQEGWTTSSSTTSHLLRGVWAA
jgi:hypothetical protein